MPRLILALGLLALVAIPAGAAAQERPVPCIPFETYPANGCIAWIKDFWYTPDPLQIPVGTTVTWLNTAQQPHTVTDSIYSFDSGEIAPRGTFSFTFQTPGYYTYTCAIHPNMSGTVMVE